MSAALGLDSLLAALREAGLPVGVAEMARLQQVFALGPQVEEDRRLKAVLRAVLVKSAEDHVRFEPVFDAWMGRVGQEVAFREAPPPPLPPDPITRTPRRRRPLWRVLAATALPLLVLMLADEVRKPPKPAPVPSSPEKLSEPAPISTGRALTPDEIRKRSFETWVPVLTVTPAEWKGWPALFLGCLALFTTGGLWTKARRKGRMPEPASEPAKKGPPRVFLAPPDLAGPQLLEPREQEALVWGIGHFVAEEPTRRLDLAATVRETAKAGGIPHLRFHQARYPREVWLWIDEAADDPAIPRIADEIEAALQIHGLPVEKALYRGVPNWLVNSSGQDFAPNEVDERRDAALVAVLTDGRILARQYAADDRRVRLDTLLRSLSHWPRLAFVDFAAEPGDLAAVLAKHSLLRIVPSGLAAFLGGDETAKRKTGGTVSGDAVWAAACAVAPSSIDELRAFQLRRRLGLATSPWALRLLRTEAPGPPGRLQWQSEDRARRVNWLTAAEAQTEDSVASGSLLGRTLDFWEEVYDRELKNDSWLETPAHQHLAMERALLALWREPGKGVRDLYPLHGSALRGVVQRHLQDLAPANWGSAELLHLPWSWESLAADERVMLQQMGLGGGMPAARLRRPGRLWMGVGICLGLAVGAIGSAALSGERNPEGPPIIVHGSGKPVDAFQGVREAPLSLTQNGARSWSVVVGTRKSSVRKEVTPGGRVNVRWEKRRQPCVSKLVDGSEAWSCGTIEVPRRFSQEAGRRVIFLTTLLYRLEADAMAVDLLDSGSADQVVLGLGLKKSQLAPALVILSLNFLADGTRPDQKTSSEELENIRRRLEATLKKLESSLGEPSENSGRGPANVVVTDFNRKGRREEVMTFISGWAGEELLVLPDSNWGQLRRTLRFEGKRTIQQVWPDVKLLAGSPSAQLQGLSACRNGELLEVDGMTFVHVCPGTFTMGSANNDPQADDGEKPAHQVTLSEYWIGKTEVTNAQYRKDHLDHQGPDAFPVTDVSWDAAKNFCERHGWRLPREAEWEYAARAGTQTLWSFGADESQLGEYAWFDGNSGGEAHPVATRDPNPWGLYDMHGNVWEWVEDWYGPYLSGPQADPKGPDSGVGRSLRGGAFYVSPRDLRSALRFRFQPSFGFESVGFRCARSPRRQP